MHFTLSVIFILTLSSPGSLKLTRPWSPMIGEWAKMLNWTQISTTGSPPTMKYSPSSAPESSQFSESRLQVLRRWPCAGLDKKDIEKAMQEVRLNGL